MSWSEVKEHFLQEFVLLIRGGCYYGKIKFPPEYPYKPPGISNNKQPSCFYPIPQAADCITRVAERANAPVVYLSTDAAESETGLLQSLVVVNGKAVPLVKQPARNSAEKWDALLYRHGIEGDSQVEAMLDKTISAMSSVFIGASGSTFTEDILRLQKDWGSASVCDEYLCQGEEPNFIAENE